jgi:hypothetical protein
MVKNPSLVWLLPALILLLVLAPMKLSYFDAYISFGMTSVGIFSAWLTFGCFSFMKAQKNAQQWGFVFGMVTLLYNPLMSKYTLANILASISHSYVIVLNVTVAAIFLYHWWLVKHKAN